MGVNVSEWVSEWVIECMSECMRHWWVGEVRWGEANEWVSKVSTWVSEWVPEWVSECQREWRVSEWVSKGDINDAWVKVNYIFKDGWIKVIGWERVSEWVRVSGWEWVSVSREWVSEWVWVVSVNVMQKIIRIGATFELVYVAPFIESCTRIFACGPSLPVPFFTSQVVIQNWWWGKCAVSGTYKKTP